MKERRGIADLTMFVDGVRVHYSRAGLGPALVLVHGLVGSRRNWNRNIAALAEVRTVYAIDLANAGESQRVDGLNPGLEACADRVASCMEALGIESAEVAGHSHGGAIAMILASRHPQRVSKLVLFAPANPFCTLGHAQMRFYATRVGSVFARRVIPRLPRILHRRSLERMYGEPRKIDDGVLRGYTDGLDSAAIAHILAIMLRWSEDMALLKAALPNLSGLPTLLFWGDRDRAVALASGEELARTLGAPLQIVRNAGHIAFEESPEICNPILRGWLTSGIVPEAVYAEAAEFGKAGFGRMTTVAN